MSPFSLAVFGRRASAASTSSASSQSSSSSSASTPSTTPSTSVAPSPSASTAAIVSPLASPCVGAEVREAARPKLRVGEALRRAKRWVEDEGMDGDGLYFDRKKSLKASNWLSWHTI